MKKSRISPKMPKYITDQNSDRYKFPTLIVGGTQPSRVILTVRAIPKTEFKFSKNASRDVLYAIQGL